MTLRRILFCDDDADIRAIIELSLALDASFETRGCVSAAEVLATAAEWSPDLILLDVMMPGMDGPTALALLHGSPCTESIPVVFMTARTQAYECQRFISLGAAAVIAKPFDPMTLASLVNGYFADGGTTADGRDRFWLRLAEEEAKLGGLRSGLTRGTDAHALAAIRDIAHGLVAAAGVCGYCGMCGLSESGEAAGALERAAVAGLAAGGDQVAVVRALDRLSAQIALRGAMVPRGQSLQLNRTA